MGGFLAVAAQARLELIQSATESSNGVWTRVLFLSNALTLDLLPCTTPERLHVGG
jgi:hypothetical protein